MKRPSVMVALWRRLLHCNPSRQGQLCTWGIEHHRTAHVAATNTSPVCRAPVLQHFQDFFWPEKVHNLCTCIIVCIAQLCSSSFCSEEWHHDIQVPAILFGFQSFSKFCQDDAEVGGSKFEARSHSTRTVGIQREMSQDWSNSFIQVAYTPLVSRAVNYAYSSKRNVEGKLGAGVPRFIRLNTGE